MRTRILWIMRERSRRAVALWAAAIAITFTIAATSKAVVDVLRWREGGAAARSVGADRSAPLQQRINAIVVMQRDSYENRRQLLAMEAEGGEIAVHARNALRAIDAAGK